MADFAALRPEHVLQALEEYDEVGGLPFLAAQGLGPAHDFALQHDGRNYDARGVLVAAHRAATGTPPAESDLRHRVAPRVLRELGFDVAGYTDARQLGPDQARPVWAAAARGLLVDVAATYHATVSVAALADYAQRRALLRTTQPAGHWVGDLLRLLTEENLQRGEPLLAALVVDESLRVGPAYARLVSELRSEPVEDADEHAARERLACYRWARADLPPGGGEPGPMPVAAPVRARAARPDRAPAGTRSRPERAPRAPRAAASRPATRAVAAKPVERPLQTCPVHFTVLPVSGVCDLCE